MARRQPEPAPVQGRRAYDGFAGVVERTFTGSRPSWAPIPRAPAGAPNVVVVLCDDLGFSDVGCYGSEIPTPHIDQLARDGVRYANFHVTPLCSPTRASLLTGVNHHLAGVGYLTIQDMGFPGYRSQISESVATAAEVFSLGGYATFAVGKWHLSPSDSLSAAGDKRSWPLQRGFERFYGFMEVGLNNWHHPNLLYEDNHVVETDRYPDGYFFTDDITTKAISMIRAEKTADPEKPFFLYYANGAVHAPLMAKPDDLARQRGRYAAGWDEARRARFDRQLAMGIVPPDTELPPRNHEPGYGVQPWAELSEREQRLFARHMEVYAAMVDNVDQNIGRLQAALAELGELENTIFVFTSDNGGSREGGSSGTTEYFRTVNIVHLGQDVLDLDKDSDRIDLLGGPRIMSHYPWGWAMVSNTPFRLYKSTTFAGGQQVPLIVSWPAGIAERGAIRRQYAHVTDALPTLVELAGLSFPTERDGRPLQQPTGASFAATLNAGNAESPHPEQYYEMGGQRGYYRAGWEALTLHARGTPFEDDRWHLYEVAVDPTETRDLAAERPELVGELVQAWEEAAWVNHVYPLDDGTGLHAMRPPGERVRDSVVLRPSNHTYETWQAKKLIHGRSFSINVQAELAAGQQGVLVAHGDQGGGYVLYLEDGLVMFAYNAYGALTLLDAGPMPSGSCEFVVDAVAPGGGVWTFAIAVDGERRAVSEHVPMLSLLAPFEGIDIGIDRRSPVSWPLYEKHGTFRFDGVIRQVTYLPGEFAEDAVERYVAELLEAAHKYE
jgi:arylsulfatase